MNDGLPSESGLIRRRAIDAAALSALPDSLHPVLRRVYAARHVVAAELDQSLAALLPVGGFPAVLAAAARLAEARERRERIVVIGDFDADGATASALMISVLRQLDFEQPAYLVPDRFRLGYGLSSAIAEDAARLGPQLLITVDNGISSIEGVQRAHELGMEVIVTDHHLPGDQLPKAAFLVNPNLPGESFAGKNLAGVGVAFYLAAALARELENRGQLPGEKGRAAVNAVLDLVALGTVADLVALDHNNRVLVAAGLRRLQAGHGRPGLQALFEVAGRDIGAARASDLGFAVAPRLNAAGRLTDMSLGIDCLLAPTLAAARPLAERLDRLNRERRERQALMEADAQLHLDRAREAASDPAECYCLFDSGWHEGVVGLVATRIKDQVRRPVVAFAPAEEPGMLKGSARSVPGIHIRDLIDRVATRYPQLVSKFGGHAMAAGLSLRADDLPQFRAALCAEVARHDGALADPGLIWSDGPLTGDELELGLAEQLAEAGPWGQGFPDPLFDGCFEVVDSRVLKDRHLKMRLRVPGTGRSIDAIAFNQPELPAEGPPRFAYRLDVNEFRQQRQVQLVVEHMQSD